MSDTEEIDMTEFKQEIERLRDEARAHSFHSMLLTHRIANAALLAVNLSVPKEGFLTACALAFDETKQVIDVSSEQYFDERKMAIIKKHTLAQIEKEGLLTEEPTPGKVDP
jgi:hypothetical protein